MSNESDKASGPAPDNDGDQTSEIPAQRGWEPGQPPPPPPPPPGAFPPGFGTGTAYQPGPASAPGWWGYGQSDPRWGPPPGGAYRPAATDPSQAAGPRRGLSRGWAITTGIAVVLAAAAVGGLAGHAIRGTNAAALSPAAAPSTPANGGFGPGTGSGSGSSPGNGSGFPFGNGSGSSGTAPSSAGTGPADASSIAAHVDPGLVDVNTTIDYGAAEGAGTGMVLTSGGEVLTNNHVVEGATTISVTDVGNGRTYDATVVGYSVARDVAVLKLTGASGLQTVTTTAAKVSVGEEVVGIGNAGGAGGTPSYAGGTVTATSQSITANDELTGTAEKLSGMIGTNADIQSGDSGGPLVNSSGQVIGMDTAGSETFQFGSQSGGSGFAIPIGVATSIARQITAGQSSTTVHAGPTAFLGVEIGQPASGLGQGSGYGGSGTTSGVQISGVVSGSAAAGSGLAAGDVITSVDGHGVTSQSALQSVMVNDVKPGQTVTVRYTDTAGQQHTVSVVLTSGPPS